MALFDELERDPRDLEDDEDERDEEREETEQEDDEDGERESRRSRRSSSGEAEDDEEEWDPERAKRTIKTLRAREKELDRRARELERENKRFKRQGQSRDQQLTDDLKEKDEELGTLKSENETMRQDLMRFSFMEQMESAGFTRKQAKYLWKDRDEIGVEPEFDDRRRLTNAKALRRAAKEYDPEMYATGSADGGRRERQGSEVGSGGMNDMIRGAAGRA